MSFLHCAGKAIRKVRRDYFNEPRVKGFIGEKFVYQALKEKPFLLHNIVLKEPDSAQIDHILVCEQGIIVIETKNYGGFIYGHAINSIWTQFIGANKYSFYNPIMQNDRHVKLLTVLFPEYASLFRSAVVFTPRSKLRIGGVDNVIYLTNLDKYIDGLEHRIADIKTMETIYKQLKTLSSVS